MIKKAILFYLALVGISIVITSCCETIFTVTPDFNVSFTNIPEERTISTDSDTIRVPFIYSLDAVIVADNSTLNDLALISSAYAFQCNEVYENGYRIETASLSLDKPFVLDGHTIAAGTNILELDSQFSADQYNAQVYEYGIRVWFKEPFLQRSTFPLARYTFTASVSMEDGTLIQSQTSAIIHIN